MKDIKGYKGLYAITEDGQVWSYKRKKFLKPRSNGKGYLKIGLYKDGKGKDYYIHRLVLMTYKPIENMEQMDVDHIDFNKENNCLGNLRWLNPIENRKRQKKVKEIRCIETKIVYPSASEAERQTGFSHGDILSCCRGERKATSGYHFMYEEDFQDMLVAELLEKTFLDNNN